MAERTQRTWHENETCERCGRETKTIYVDGYGQLCLVCCDRLAEGEDEAALDALDTDETDEEVDD